MDDDFLDAERLSELLDHCVGTGPVVRTTPWERLARGQAALRQRRQRRRGVLVAACVVALAVVGIGGAVSGMTGARSVADGSVGTAVQGGTASSGGADEAVDPDDLWLARCDSCQQARAAQSLTSDQFPVVLADDGTVVVRDGWVVVHRGGNPLGVAPPAASLGVVVSNGDTTRWMMLTVSAGVNVHGEPDLGPSASAVDAGAGYRRFEDWLASVTAADGAARATLR